MHLRLFVASMAVTMVVAAITTSATVLVPADLTTAVAESNVIVYGRVVDVRSAVTTPARGIETFVTVAVVDALKGNPGRNITFRVPNGQVGRYRRVVVGAPEFDEGDEIVIFLQGSPAAIPVLFGLNQGVFRVARQAGAPVVLRGSPDRRPLPLEVFAREIETLVETRR
jgi:hypothetical protein